MKKCYIVGPMRGIPEYNYPAFTEAAHYMRTIGWIVYNPVEMDKADNEDYSSFSSEEQVADDTPEKARRFARRDTNIILNYLKAENGDMIVALPNWKNSDGARAELALAKWVGLQRIDFEQVKRGGYDVTGEN